MTFLPPSSWQASSFFAAADASDRFIHVGDPEQSWCLLAVEPGHWSLRGYGRRDAKETAIRLVSPANGGGIEACA